MDRIVSVGSVFLPSNHLSVVYYLHPSIPSFHFPDLFCNSFVSYFREMKREKAFSFSRDTQEREV